MLYLQANCSKTIGSIRHFEQTTLALGLLGLMTDRLISSAVLSYHPRLFSCQQLTAQTSQLGCSQTVIALEIIINITPKLLSYYGIKNYS